jgi:hypothetical protein
MLNQFNQTVKIACTIFSVYSNPVPRLSRPVLLKFQFFKPQSEKPLAAIVLVA